MNSAKGCPNNECAAHKKKTLFKSSINYCPECGTKLAAVCKIKGCHTFLNDDSKKLCARCDAKRADRIDKTKKVGAAAGGAIVTAVGIIATAGEDVLQLASKIKKN